MPPMKAEYGGRACIRIALMVEKGFDLEDSARFDRAIGEDAIFWLLHIPDLPVRARVCMCIALYSGTVRPLRAASGDVDEGRVRG